MVKKNLKENLKETVTTLGAAASSRCASGPFPSKLVTEMVTALGQQKRGLSTERGGN